MKRLPLRFALPLINLLLALILCVIGIKQNEVAHLQHPGAFYHGAPSGYLPSALKISYVINSPSLAAAIAVYSVHESRLGWREDWFPLGYIEYYIALLGFWWLVGESIDNRRASVSTSSTWLEAAGLAFSAFVIYEGFIGIDRRFLDIDSVRVATVVWGVVLSGYFLINLIRSDWISVSDLRLR